MLLKTSILGITAHEILLDNRACGHCHNCMRILQNKKIPRKWKVNKLVYIDLTREFKDTVIAATCHTI